MFREREEQPMSTLTSATRVSRGLIAAAVLVALSTAPNSAATRIDVPAREHVLAAYANLPVAFVENRGQTDARVRFYAQGSRFAVHLTPDAATLSLVEPTGGRGAVL